MHINYWAYFDVWSFERKTYTWWSRESSYSWFSWNPVDFMWNSADFTWNLVDFMWIKRHSLPTALHKTEKFLLSYLIGLSKERPILDHHAKAHILDFMKSGGFQVKSSGFQVKSARFHTWNPPDFTGEIRVKSARFHGWNLPDFMGEIWVKSTRFHRWNPGEIHQISWVKSTRFRKTNCQEW